MIYHVSVVGQIEVLLSQCLGLGLIGYLTARERVCFSGMHTCFIQLL